MVSASPKMEAYFSDLVKNVNTTYEYATKARKMGFDPSTQVDVRLAKNLAERVIGLISIIEPRIETSGAVERIIELEKEYGSQDWRVAMVIALEVAQNKFVEFDSKLTAMEVGIRIGFAYVTVGVVSSPLEGFTGIELKKRRDGKEYFSLRFAGPIRNAGGTAAATSVIIADYVRKHMGYAKYDPDDKEVARIYTEIMDYHDKVTNLQYVPSEEESNFLTKNLPVEIDGDASEKFEVSNQKDLPRVAANRIRSGVCLIHSSCLPLKAKKLWKNLSKWIGDMEMDDWGFMQEFLKIQEIATSKSKTAASDSNTPKVEKTKEEEYIIPNYTYIADLVGGRPVISHPLAEGGLRLRYGRSRTSGMSAQSIHPATMHVMDNFIAVGTQLKVERPGKATSVTSCDTIEGPIVELDTGEVLQIHTEEHAKEITKNVVKIHYLGDVLINYGDFFDRAATLLPPGYCSEWWILELERDAKEKYGVETQSEVIDKLTAELATQNNSLTKEYLTKLFDEPITTPVKPSVAFLLARATKTPLHPSHTLYYKLLSLEKAKLFLTELSKGSQTKEENGVTQKTLLPYSSELKTICAKLGLPHTKAGNEFIVIDKLWSYILEQTLNYKKTSEITELIRELDSYTIEFNETKLKNNFLAFIQAQNGIPLRDKAGIFVGSRMGRPEKAKMRKHAGKPWTMAPQEHDEVDEETGETKKRIIMEHNMKPQLREAFEIHANKDGTVRYDGSEVPITHFRPFEIGVEVEKLKELGYTHDIKGVELTKDTQVLELFPQDVVIPCCEDSPNEPADEVLFRTTKFVDTLLEKLYGLEPFYNLKTKKDLAGQYVFGLAPHTSAATVGRIVGFTKTQGLFCHPMFHAAMRRDCDGDETCVFLLMDGFLNFATKFLPKHRGGTMDAPLVLTSIMNPMEVDDMVFNMDLAWKYPIEFYDACCNFKKPWDVKIPLLNDVLDTPKQFEGMGYTHESSDFNKGVLCSAYKTLPSMKAKVDGSMALAVKIEAADEIDMAEIVIKKHFISDIAGNLRKFTLQEFRCTKCGTKYRRPPLRGRCQTCGHPKLIFTIHQASVTKYLVLAADLAEKYDINPYTKQVIELLQMRCDSLFGREKEKQTGLGDFFS